MNGVYKALVHLLLLLLLTTASTRWYVHNQGDVESAIRKHHISFHLAAAVGMTGSMMTHAADAENGVVVVLRTVVVVAAAAAAVRVVQAPLDEERELVELVGGRSGAGSKENVAAVAVLVHVSVEEGGPPLSSASQLHFCQNTEGYHVGNAMQLHLGGEGEGRVQ